jgi:hypothetical protein
MVIHIGLKCILFYYPFCRSPFTNKYFPPLADAILPSPALRRLEQEVNELIEKYVQVFGIFPSKCSVNIFLVIMKVDCHLPIFLKLRLVLLVLF